LYITIKSSGCMHIQHGFLDEILVVECNYKLLNKMHL
jgi:hypothetical protein